jgi:flagellar hook protein FlgE
MSGINSALLSGVTGLSANSAALASISDDIANVNTIGYKANVTEFSDLVTQAAGSGYFAGGVQAISTQNVAEQGVLQASSTPTNMAISGQGFFVTSQNAGSPGTSNAALFTRAGAFTANNQGYLVNAAGLYLQGWQADASGNVTTDSSNLALLSPINVNSISSIPVPTTLVSIDANIQSSTPVSQAVKDIGSTTATDGYSATSTTTSMAAYNATTGVGTKPDFTMQVPVSNSQGGTQTIQIDFLKSETPNQWYAEVVGVPASSITNSGGVPGQISSGVVAFNSTGQLNLAATTLFGSAGATSLTFGASNAAAPTGSEVNWATSAGLSGQTVNFDLASATSGLTQNDGPSAVSSINANGTPSGSLTSVEVDASGDITAVFGNGVTRKIAQVAIATFSDPGGLTSVSGDAYQASQASGTFNLKTAGVAGAGTVQASNLESSTVDLSQEFTNMIITQRAYSASSKIITTADSMLQDLISIIR